MTQIKKRNKSFEPIICENCNKFTAVIIHEKVYMCGECYMFDQNIPFDTALTNLRAGFEKKRFKN
jgi:protein-arginine kinase activator protein McsA